MILHLNVLFFLYLNYVIKTLRIILRRVKNLLVEKKKKRSI